MYFFIYTLQQQQQQATLPSIAGQNEILLQSQYVDKANKLSQYLAVLHNNLLANQQKQALIQQQAAQQPALMPLVKVIFLSFANKTLHTQVLALTLTFRMLDLFKSFYS